MLSPSQQSFLGIGLLGVPGLLSPWPSGLPSWFCGSPPSAGCLW